MELQKITFRRNRLSSFRLDYEPNDAIIQKIPKYKLRKIKKVVQLLPTTEYLKSINEHSDR